MSTFSAAEASEKFAGSSISKTLLPENHTVTILDMYMEVPPYDANAKSIVLLVEGPDRTEEGFEGFFLDKDHEELGRYKGQIGRVRASQYAFTDYKDKKTGKLVTTRDQQIYRWLWNFGVQLGYKEQMIEENIQGNTIEEFFENLKPILVNKENKVELCIAGQEYLKDGYTQYGLYLPKADKGKFAFARHIEGEESKTLLKFDPVVHIRKKKEAEAVEEFSGDGSAPAKGGSDLELE